MSFFFVVPPDTAFVIGKPEYPEDPDRCAIPEKRREMLVYGRSIAPRGSFRSDCQVKAILHRTMDKARRHKMPDQWTKLPLTAKKTETAPLFMLLPNFLS